LDSKTTISTESHACTPNMPVWNSQDTNRYVRTGKIFDLGFRTTGQRVDTPILCAHENKSA